MPDTLTGQRFPPPAWQLAVRNFALTQYSSFLAITAGAGPFVNPH